MEITMSISLVSQLKIIQERLKNKSAIILSDGYLDNDDNVKEVQKLQEEYKSIDRILKTLEEESKFISEIYI